MIQLTELSSRSAFCLTVGRCGRLFTYCIVQPQIPRQTPPRHGILQVQTTWRKAGEVITYKLAREYIRVVLMAINFPKEDLRFKATSCERIDNASFHINRLLVDTRCGMNMRIPVNGPLQSYVSFFLACLLFYSRKEQTKQHINQHTSLSGSAYRTVTKQPSHDLMKGIGCPCLLSSELTQINFSPFYSAAGQADPPTSQASNHTVTYTPYPD